MSFGVAANGVTRTELDELVTPELALVDQALAERARSRLAEPDDTIGRLEALVLASRISALAATQAELPRLERSSRSLYRTGRVADPGSRRRGHRGSAVLAGCMTGGLLFVGLLLGVRVDLRGSPADADTTAVGELPADYAAPKSPAPAPAARKARGGRQTREDRDSGTPSPRAGVPPQRFAWAPSPGASGYHVELFHGALKVFAADTTRPALTIPGSWIFGGRSRSLEPGDYRWYVWPVASGRQAARAIVQAKLVIPSP